MVVFEPHKTLGGADKTQLLPVPIPIPVSINAFPFRLLWCILSRISSYTWSLCVPRPRLCPRSHPTPFPIPIPFAFLQLPMDFNNCLHNLISLNTVWIGFLPLENVPTAVSTCGSRDLPNKQRSLRAALHYRDTTTLIPDSCSRRRSTLLDADSRGSPVRLRLS